MINKNILEKVINVGLKTGADFCEVFAENKIGNSYELDTGKVNKASTASVYGVGIRIALKGNYVYGYTNDTSEESLVSLAKDLSQSFSDKVIIENVTLAEKKLKNNHTIKTAPNQISIEDKMKIMHLAYQTAKEYDDSITQVKVTMWDEDQKVQIANSEGLLVNDTRIRTRLMVLAVASDEKTMQTGYESLGSQAGYEIYSDTSVKAVATESARIAVTMLWADECSSGEMPVVLNNGFGGVIFHEACGHPLEATAVATGFSVFSGKIGTKIASEIVTAIDDGTIINGWGSGNIDDEGNETKRNVLIKDGVLQSFLVDKINGRKMDTDANGVSRRQSYKYAPTSRMSNTYIDNGKSTFDEIIAATKKGIFAKKLGGGSVDPSTGDFNFSVMEGYLIEDGKITTPIRGATLVGNGANVLHKIDMVGNNLERARGMCGSISGSIPTDVGQPTLRVSSITVGGRKENN